MRIPTVILAAALVLSQGPAFPQSSGNDLPNIGTPADSVWTQDEEYQVGRMVMKGLRDAGQLLEDPEVNEYLQTVGGRLASQAQAEGQRFTFFGVKSPEINAFALPGGFIGVNSGLLLATANESELAGVLGHEIAHVTQRHIARSVKAQGRAALVSAAALLAAILVGAAGGGGDAMMGAVAAAQGVAAQQQLNFTRANEYEADRVGIGTLAAAGFDPMGVPDFFETLGRRYGGVPGQVPEFIQSHPLTTNRIAEGRGRAREYGKREVADSLTYRLSRERLRVLTVPEGIDAAAYYEKSLPPEEKRDDSHKYGRALSLMASGQADKAIPILQKLSKQNASIIAYRSALGEALMQAGRTSDALDVFALALQLFPRNIPLSIRYGEALLRADQARLAHEILLDLFNSVQPTPDQARFIALCANAAGDVADAYSYMAEYHLMSGDLMLAINQLQLALAVPNISDVQRARFRARMDQLKEWMPKGSENRLARRGSPEREERARER